jgi:hypothetical protein
MRIEPKLHGWTKLWLATGGAMILALVVLSQHAAAGGTISAVTPEEGTIGTVIVVEGLGFGEKKPKVELRDSFTKKRCAAKVVASSDTKLEILVKKAKLGLYDLTVKPKGKDAASVTAPAAFKVAGPAVASASLALTPGAPFTVKGDLFGSKSGKVLVAGKPAVIEHWSNKEIHCRAPFVADGQHVLLVSNPVGISLPVYADISNAEILFEDDFDSGSPVKWAVKSGGITDGVFEVGQASANYYPFDATGGLTVSLDVAGTVYFQLRNDFGPCWNVSGSCDPGWYKITDCITMSVQPDSAGFAVYANTSVVGSSVVPLNNAADLHNYRIVIEPDGTCRFHRDGVLIQTHHNAPKNAWFHLLVSGSAGTIDNVKATKP